MLNPTSKLRKVARGGVRRRPSGAMVVASLALFVALSGGAYAAVTIPAHSVGADQLKTFAVTNPKLGTSSVGTRKIMNAAVTYSKIKPGSVGTVRIDKNEVQARLQSSCTTGQAITAVSDTGVVTCGSAGASETSSAAGSAVALGTTSAAVSAVSLPSGSAYEVQSNPYITVTPSTNSSADAQHVVVTCTLSDNGTAQAQRSASFDIPAYSATNPTETASIPLIAIAPSSTAASSSQVSCVSNVTNAGGNAATNPASATAQGQIYATTLASATTGTTPATTTTTTTTTTAP